MVLSPRIVPLIWHFYKEYKFVSLIFMVLALLAGLWGPLNNLLIMHIIDSLPQARMDISILYLPAGLLVINFIIFDNVTWRTMGWINYKYQAEIKYKITSFLFKYVINNSHRYFLDNLTGRIANQINCFADNLELIIHNIMPDFFRAISLLLASYIMAYLVNPYFFFIILLWSVVFFGISIPLAWRLTRLSGVHAQKEAIIAGQIVDKVTNQNNIRIFARGDYELNSLTSFTKPAEKAFKDKKLFFVLLNIVEGLMIAAMIAASSYILVHLYGRGVVSVGDFALIVGLTIELGHMMWFTNSRIEQFNEAVGKCRHYLCNLATEYEVKEIDNAKILEVKGGEIKFEQVNFHYQGNNPLFRNKNLLITAGQKVGLVGYSGSGKSSFVSLILRLYDVNSGSITIDGQDIKRLTLESLYKNIGLIPQDSSLFHRSIAENIGYAKPGASIKEIIRAAKLSKADEFIQLLPQKYDTLVGERGVKLSGGQRQRISIARAILKNAPILVLDEATSQLDSIIEISIQKNLFELMSDKTTIVIAHRLSTLVQMDRVLVFEDGKIIQDGSHSQLLDEDGLYKEMWQAQVGGFLPEKKKNE